MRGICTFYFIAVLSAQVYAQPQFQAQMIDSSIAIGYGVAIGDVDGDGKHDILLADKKQFAWYRNGDWKRFVMIDNLTDADNVCIAARDIDGDGKVEVAVGAQWNPGETSDTSRSGSVHFLLRPDDPTALWKAVELHHEPTVHRMRWVKTGSDHFQLVVLPLHGRGNKNGAGRGVKIIAYDKPADPRSKWRYALIDSSMHLTHNFDVVAEDGREHIYVGGKEGVSVFAVIKGQWKRTNSPPLLKGKSFGEVRVSKTGENKFIAGIEPMHGNTLTLYYTGRIVLTDDLNQGHALATADLLNTGTDQVVVGWREPNAEKKVGIKLFKATTTPEGRWEHFWIDDNGMACEDLQVADLDGDGKNDIVAAGRATHNLKIYWNKSR